MSASPRARSFIVRAFAPEDRAAVRDISVETAWLGAPSPERIIDPELWADVFTRYFTDREPQHTWVVERTSDRHIRGYLTGTLDLGALERDWIRLAPRLALRVVEKRLFVARDRRRAIASFLRALALGQLTVPRRVRHEYPARFAFTLSEDARGQGLGPLLLDPFFVELQARGVPGVHVQMVSSNEAAIRFIRRVGFQLVASWPLTAFDYLAPERVELLTWVLPLGRPARST